MTNFGSKAAAMWMFRMLTSAALVCASTAVQAVPREASQNAAQDQPSSDQTKDLNTVNVIGKHVPTLSERADSVRARFTAGHNRIKALNDAIIPDSSDGGEQWQLWGTWGSKPFAEMWVEYRWKEPVEPSHSTAYFWADQSGTAQGRDCLNMGVQFPQSWKLMYYNDRGEWVDLPNPSGYRIHFGSGSDVDFDKVRTTRLRLVMEPFGRGRCRAAVGLKEWEVD